MTREDEVGEAILHKWVGRTLESPKDIENAYLELDEEGFPLFCKDKDGSILEVLGGQDSPELPLVRFNILTNVGLDTQNEKARKETVVDFLARKPLVIDISKENTQ
ncbi:MAG: hypothetical protein ACD_61C00194G0006 [uncultured bacterium]|nr:MAG: hypothetical protein ACD_61C00194G0006 [uncultured bacterium]